MTSLDRETSVQTQFIKDIANHEMTVHHADGVFRHLAFKRANTVAYSFQITTWPGSLCISGDMGSYVFARLPDMFSFFRGDHINPAYWAAKLTADDKLNGHRTFSHHRYVEALKKDFAAWHFHSDEGRKRSWAAIDDDVSGLMGASTTEEALRLASEWECPISGQRFTDFWGNDLEEFSSQFLWCCHAIQWAISQFDKTNPNSTQAAAA